MLACVVFLAAAGSLVGRAQPARRGKELFSPAGPAPSQQAVPTGTVERSRRTRIVSALMSEDTMSLNLFDDIVVEARRTKVAGVEGDTTWFGQVDGEPLSAVTFVRVDGILQGSIRTARGVFSVEPVAGGPDYLIRQLNPSAPLPELPPLVPPQPPSRIESFRQPDEKVDESDVFEVLVLYTEAARREAGGDDAAVKARIALGVAETNIAYANSGVPHRLQLAGTELVGYVEAADLGDDLQRLTSPSDGFIDIAQARRAAVGADLVTLIVGSTTGGSCGVAWVMQNLSTSFAPYAFSVVAYPCISPNYTFAHELAHNMGSAHAPADPNAPPVFPYSYGYKDPSRQFRTIMAYDCPGGCPRILHFSNPAVFYGGAATGTPEQHDNALSITQTGPTVSRFMPTRPPSERLGAPRSVSLESQGRSVRLSWLPPDQGIASGYSLEVGSAEGFSDIASLVVNDATVASFVQPVVAAGNYFIRVRAFNQSGPGEPSPAVHLVMTDLGRCVAPAAPPDLLLPRINGNNVTLTWVAPSGGGPVESYALLAGTRPEATDLGILHTASTTPTITIPAAPGVYFVRVAGANGCGIGVPSNELAVVVGPPVPAPPTHVAAAVSADHRVTLSWQPSWGGGVPMQYVVEGGSAAGSADIGLLPTSGPEPFVTVEASPGRYFVRVRAVNTYGRSVASEEIVVEVP